MNFVLYFRQKEETKVTNKIDEKGAICKGLYESALPLIEGENRESEITKSKVDEMIEQLRKCREVLDEENTHDDLPLHELLQKFKNSVQSELQERELENKAELKKLQESNGLLYQQSGFLETRSRNDEEIPR